MLRTLWSRWVSGGRLNTRQWAERFAHVSAEWEEQRANLRRLIQDCRQSQLPDDHLAELADVDSHYTAAIDSLCNFRGLLESRGPVAALCAAANHALSAIDAATAKYDAWYTRATADARQIETVAG